MMSQDQKQFEMFDKHPSSHSEHNLDDQRGKGLLYREFNARRLIVGIIIFIVINLLSFSFGVERGLRLTKTGNSVKNVKKELIKSVPSPEKTKVILKPSLDKPDSIEYSIQVASYRTESKAAEEVEALRKRGYQPFVLRKGRYAVVCVGRFKDKSEANTSLSKLKKIYSDSYVRRL